ncbi:MAG TPA: NUDIX domain-containing protein [Tepidisphaeraceae bacterium]|nr:NUDIX domain-containing protein [Tepidisphaeraceae bacterium]
MLKFPAIGIWRPGQITVSWTQSSRPVIPQVEELIEQAWLAGTQKIGRHLFDGPMCRMESFDARDGQLALTFSRTSYKPFWGTNLNHPEIAEEFGAAALANPVGASALLISSDGFLLMGRRNNSVAYYPGRVHPFAGAIEPSDNLDVFEEVRRELREELSLTPKDVSEILCLGIAEDQSLRQPELIFAVRTKRTREQIEANLEPTEHQSVWTTSATQESVEKALGGDEWFTPVAVAALALVGRNLFGIEWFDKTRGPAGRR